EDLVVGLLAADLELVPVQRVVLACQVEPAVDEEHDDDKGRTGHDPAERAAARSGLHAPYQLAHALGQCVGFQLFAMFRFHAGTLPVKMLATVVRRAKLPRTSRAAPSIPTALGLDLADDRLEGSVGQVDPR